MSKQLTHKELKKMFDVEIMRGKLGLNPICPSCGRVMRTKTKNKYYGEYFCICKPDLILCIG